MIEATLIIPVLISTIITVIYILMALYTSVEENCLIHSTILFGEERNPEIGNFIRKTDLLKGLI